MRRNCITQWLISLLCGQWRVVQSMLIKYQSAKISQEWGNNTQNKETSEPMPSKMIVNEFQSICLTTLVYMYSSTVCNKSAHEQVCICYTAVSSRFFYPAREQKDRHVAASMQFPAGKHPQVSPLHKAITSWWYVTGCVCQPGSCKK